MDLSSVIVTYQSRDVLLQCLTALAAAGGGVTSETVVVDNDPRDGVADALRQHFPEVRLIANRENVGFARAVNQGIAATSGAFVLILNPDCLLRPGAIAALIEYLKSHPRAGVVGPKLVNPDGSLEYSARAFPDHFTFLFNRYSLLTRLFPNNRFSRRYLMTDWDHRLARDVDWLSGACLLARRTAIEQVGVLDEAFFMFNEDVDWCRRMKLGGWTVSYVPEATGEHRVGASRRRVAARVIFERHRGMIHYFHKHHAPHPPWAWIADGFIYLRAGLMIAANAVRPR
jgi:GT2 family glycosyltransferase